MNITDIDDKTIKASSINNVPLKEYTKKYENAFGIIFDDVIAAIYALLIYFVILVPHVFYPLGLFPVDYAKGEYPSFLNIFKEMDID